uniref:ETS domain-containing protein n=1 Tax=Octopus bimaculoides TaxID=37653 RepID=A0A0L8HEI6_OCTBM
MMVVLVVVAAAAVVAAVAVAVTVAVAAVLAVTGAKELVVMVAVRALNATSCNVVIPKLETPLLGESIIQNRIDDSVHSCQLSTNSDGNVPMHSNNQQKMFQPCQPKRKPGRPRLHPLNKDSAGIKKMKILPLWEFIYSILQNNNFNPFIIRWEDEANGKFRFVHSEKFAKLWGEAKNNENMNYEKLSRAMRHYYGKDIIERVEGRRLVYRFLNSAMDRLRKKTNPEIPLSEMQRNGSTGSLSK